MRQIATVSCSKTASGIDWKQMWCQKIIVFIHWSFRVLWILHNKGTRYIQCAAQVPYHKNRCVENEINIVGTHNLKFDNPQLIAYRHLISLTTWQVDKHRIIIQLLSIITWTSEDRVLWGRLVSRGYIEWHATVALSKRDQVIVAHVHCAHRQFWWVML